MFTLGWVGTMGSYRVKMSHQARGLSIEGKPVRAMWARPKDGAR